MQFIMLNNFNLFKNFVDIIINEHYLIICAKYHSSNMNNVHTICPADMVSLPAKVVWPTAFFLKKKMIFVWLLCWPLVGQFEFQLLKCV